jgi:bleomycin hydrolase
MKNSICILAMLLLPASGFPQSQDRHDKAVFEVKNDAMKDSIKARLKVPPPADSLKKVMQVAFPGIAAPAAISEFTTVWHSPPILQGLSGMCWCFSTTSFLESEIYRLTQRKIKLSELHTVYWEYVEKARAFVESRGKSHLGEGSEANAVFRIWKKYGVVPGELYTGLKDNATYHNHENTLFPEIKAYLASVKESNAWNETEVVATVRSILDHYIGPPPTTVVADGKQMTPIEFLANVVRLNPDDYVDFFSLMEKPYFQKVEFEVPDNWWHSKDYHNIPLDDFMRVLKAAIRSGYSVAIGGDFTEAGYSYGPAGIAVVPSFDVPSSAIDELSRQFRFSNETTTDDHGLHLVGYAEKDGKDWYLIKDSWSTAYNSAHPGYYFYHEDYVKLKILGFSVHKGAAREILARFKN